VRLRRRPSGSVVLAAAAVIACAPLGARAQGAAPPSAGASAASPAASRTLSDAFGLDVATRGAPGGSAVPPAAVAGVGWVRITANWADLEPARGTYAWAELDEAIRRAQAARERVLVMVQTTPRWAAPEPSAPPSVWRHQPPQRLGDWQAFVAAAATRYRGRVAAWQIEPALDLAMFRGTSEDYRQMLHAARDAVRRADRAAWVVAASPSGIDLAFIKALLGRAGDDFDALMLYPRGRTPGDVLEALGVIRARILGADARHQLWMSARPEWGAEAPLAVAALAGGVAREFWPRLDAPLATVVRLLGAARFVGPLDRGPDVYALVFTDGVAPVAVVWSAGAPRAVPLATTGALTAIGAAGRVVASGAESTVVAGPEPVFVSNPAPSVVEEARRTAQQGPFQVPRDSAHDFSKAESVSAELGATNVEHGLYNQRLRSLRSGNVVPISVDGAEAVRTDQARDAVYVYFDVDHSFAYFVDGRYDVVISVEVHRASAPQLVGFNLLYDSTSGYRFTPWQWVEAGQGWATYTFRITDANFASTWGWDFAVNGAGDKKENLVVRAVTVKKVPPGAP